MADTWVGLCDKDYVADLRKALLHVDASAHLSFVSSAHELRERMCEAPFRCGAIVGPLSGPMSSLNVAAAVAHDAMAADVVLAVSSSARGVEDRAKRAGIRTVMDLSALHNEHIADLDEPDLCSDDVPTMVLSSYPNIGASARIPRIDEQDDSSMIALPLVRAGAHGPEVQRVLVSREQMKPIEQDVQEDRRSEEHIPHNFGSEPSRMEPQAQVEDAHDDAQGPGGLAHETEPASASRAPVITFVSGRGGVGKTTIVAMMAFVASSWGLRVAVCDLDLSCGNLYSFFGVENGTDLACMGDEGIEEAEFLSSGKRLRNNLTLWGPCEKPEMAEVVYPHTEEVLDCLSTSVDLVLVDTSSTFTDAVAQAAQMSDRVVIVVDKRPGATVSQARLAALLVRLGVARTRLARLANRCGPHGKGEPMLNRADVGLETARPLRVLDDGAEVSDSMAEGRVDDLVELGSRFAESAATALAILLSELGVLPNNPEAQRAYERRKERARWSFGRRREVV